MTAPKSDQAGVRQVIRALRAAGWRPVSVWDGEEDLDVTGSTETQVIDAAMAADSGTVTFEHRDETQTPALITRGWVFFVYGNDPDEVVADYTTNLDPTLDELTRSWWS